MDHTAKYLPAGHEDGDIVTLRKAKYLRFTRRMLGYPARLDFERYNMPTDKDRTIIRAVKAGLIPWFHPSKTPDEYLEYWEEKNVEAKESDSGFRQIQSRPWGDYFYTNFLSLAPKLILKSKEYIQKRYEELQEPADVSGLPQDGSRGQAKAARGNKKKTAAWFLGEWDGHYTEWEDNTQVEEII